MATKDANRLLSPIDLFLLAIVGAAWGSAYVAIREGILSGASPLIYAGARYVLAALGLAAVAAARREKVPSTRALAISAGLGILIIGAYGALLYWGEQSTSGGFSSVLAATVPILTAVIAYRLLPSERFRLLGWIGIAVGFVGVMVLVLPSLLVGGLDLGRGPIIVLASFTVFCIGSVLLRRWNQEGETSWQIAAQFATGAGLIGILAVVTPGPEILPATAVVWGWLLLLVLVSSVFGYAVYFALHHRVGPGRANLVAYLVPLVGVGLGTGVFGEPITYSEVGGFLLVIIGLTIVYRERRVSGTSESSGPATGDALSLPLKRG